MPLCHLFTNMTDSALKEGVETRIANILASTLNKPLERVTVIITTGVRIFRNGSTEPACSVHLSSIQVFSKEKNPTYNDPLMGVITAELGIPRERVCMVYHDLDKDNVAV